MLFIQFSSLDHHVESSQTMRSMLRTPSLIQEECPKFSHPAIIKITIHARGYRIKSGRSSVAFYEVKTIVTHYELISIIAAVS